MKFSIDQLKNLIKDLNYESIHEVEIHVTPMGTYVMGNHYSTSFSYQLKEDGSIIKTLSLVSSI